MTAEELKKERQSLNLTQSQLSALMGFKKGNNAIISQYENGKRQIPEHFIKHLRLLLEVGQK